VEAVINDPEFFKRGRYYFDGVWGQAARGASGQQAILKALAPHPEGLSIEELRTQLGRNCRGASLAPLQEETLQEALKTLKRHDVVQESEGCWQIIVELFVAGFCKRRTFLIMKFSYS
jgi:DNA-binding IclR family transcriptional regulator